MFTTVNDLIVLPARPPRSGFHLASPDGSATGEKSIAKFVGATKSISAANLTSADQLDCSFLFCS
jgi:hypothetical protein